MPTATPQPQISREEFAYEHLSDLSIPPQYETVPAGNLLSDEDHQVLAAFEFEEGVCEHVCLEHQPGNETTPYWIMWWHGDGERATTGAETLPEAKAALEAMLETVRATVYEWDARLEGALAEENDG